MGNPKSSIRLFLSSRSSHGHWIYYQYGAGQRLLLTSLDVEIEVRQLYRRLSIPAAVKEVEEEDTSESERGNNE
jgi:hypothetical protein